jgi:hypothetical protein
MAKNIQEIAEGHRAEIDGQVPETEVGAFGAARLAQLVANTRPAPAPSPR